MSGYNWMYGMSNNAVDAYCSGEKPLSRWSKKDVLEKIQEIYPAVYELVRKYPVSILKNFFLYKSSWHHTSKFYNITDFYSFDEDLEIEDITSVFVKVKVKEKEKELYCLNIRIPKTDSYDVYLNLTQTQLKRLEKEKTNDMTYYRTYTMNDWLTWIAPPYEKANVKLNIYDFRKENA